MIDGWFKADLTGDLCPVFVAQVSFWQPRALALNVEFMMDTGTSHSMLAARDAQYLQGRRRDQTDSERLVTTAMGVRNLPCIRAYIYFSGLANGERRTYQYPIDLIVADAASDPDLKMPSLLGRDVLNDWNITCHAHAGELMALPRRGPLVK